jgi:hypothetical protein
MQRTTRARLSSGKFRDWGRLRDLDGERRFTINIHPAIMLIWIHNTKIYTRP